ncbi:MAG: hypothetical protein HY868_19050 [Chloroflexi bacterium]|nr:hypothetical protein [Chloroflexota bacterium]
MNFLDKLKTLFAANAGSDLMVTWLYVKCKRCGTPLAVRVDLRNDPSLDDEGTGYILRKEIMDSKCYTLMHAELQFNAAKKIVSQTIDKGEFLTREQYEAATDRGNG